MLLAAALAGGFSNNVTMSCYGCAHAADLQIQLGFCAALQGTDDLEEAMSERLQELPPPMGRQTSSKQDVDGFSFPQDMDTDAAEPSQVLAVLWIWSRAVPNLPCILLSMPPISKCNTFCLNPAATLFL